MRAQVDEIFMVGTNDFIILINFLTRNPDFGDLLTIDYSWLAVSFYMSKNSYSYTCPYKMPIYKYLFGTWLGIRVSRCWNKH
jgi:hypothetical protein